MQNIFCKKLVVSNNIASDYTTKHITFQEMFTLIKQINTESTCAIDGRFFLLGHI